MPEIGFKVVCPKCHEAGLIVDAATLEISCRECDGCDRKDVEAAIDMAREWQRMLVWIDSAKASK